MFPLKQCVWGDVRMEGVKLTHFLKNNPNTFFRIAITLKHDTATKSKMPTANIGHQAPPSKDGNI